MDEDLFASLPGGQAVIDWFGSCPRFHDGVLERLELADGIAVIATGGDRTTREVTASGHFVLDRQALVELRVHGVTGLKLEGDAGSIILDLTIRRLADAPAPGAWQTCNGPIAGDIEITIDTSVGLSGEIYGKDLSFDLRPLAQDSETAA